MTKQEEKTKTYEEVADQVHTMALQHKQQSVFHDVASSLAEKYGVEKK